VRRRAVLLSLAILIGALGALLWVDAGTRHMDAIPASSALRAGPSSDDGPNRTPAELVWAGAAVLLVAGLMPRRPRPTR
jgi:hypothetical protein